MIDVAVGIDIGTTYTKAVARTEDGTAIAICRIRSPRFRTKSTYLLNAAEWWASLKDVFRGLLAVQTPRRLYVKSICVSAIAPTLTVFDASQADRAYAILYSSPGQPENEVSLSPSDPQLTERRLTILRSVARKEKLVNPCISDLVGYVNWRLTGTLTMNSISLIETGVVGGQSACDKFAVVDKTTPRLVAPAEQIGETTVSSGEELGIDAGIPVCGGCSDTMSSVVGAGLEQASERMLYLGTFGSFMRLEVDVYTLLNVANCSSHPFRWLLSVPCFGPKIESLSSQWFASADGANRLQMLDREAMQALPGASGTLFLLPRWKGGMTPVGTYQFVADRNGDIGNVQRQARAVLESIAYAILALGIHSGETIKVSGGGGRSRAWLDILSIVLDSDVQVCHMAWEAAGVADIAARLVWPSMASRRPFYISRRKAGAFRAIIADNAKRVKEYYYELDWL